MNADPHSHRQQYSEYISRTHIIFYIQSTKRDLLRQTKNGSVKWNKVNIISIISLQKIPSKNMEH